MALLSAFPATNLLGVASSSNPVYVSPTSSANLVGSSITITTDFRSCLFYLNVNQTSPSSSHLLDVYVQHSPDAGSTLDDFVHFNQIAGKSTTGTQIAQWVRDASASSSTAANFQSVRSLSALALAAGLVLQGPTGATWKATAVASGASSSQPWKITLSGQVAQ